MLPGLFNRRAFVEVTNPEHGGLGWEFGTCLWSPVYNRAGGRSWEIMNEVQPGDFIIHFLDNGKEYAWVGVSTAATSVVKLQDEPPKADKWAGMSPYYRVSLRNFQSLPSPVGVSKIFHDYESELYQIRNQTKKGSFYVLYRGSQLRVAQGYLFAATESLYDLFSIIADSVGFDYNEEEIREEIIPTYSEPVQPDYLPPSRVTTFITRTIRDTDLVRQLKNRYEYKCQICGETIQLSNGRKYAEGHHLKPLGSPHNGPDVQDNIIILCPTHHTEFDYGSIGIEPDTMKVIHIDNTNRYHMRELAYPRNDLEANFLKYHMDHIFNKL